MVRMKLHAPALGCALLAAAFTAQASDGLDLAMKSKAIAAATAASVLAPAVAHARDPLPELLVRAENERYALELQDGRLVYRGAREFMPRIEGFTAESIALRHDGLVLRYSFR